MYVTRQSEPRHRFHVVPADDGTDDHVPPLSALAAASVMNLPWAARVRTVRAWFDTNHALCNTVLAVNKLGFEPLNAWLADVLVQMDADEESGAADDPGDGRVTLGTIHSSKGVLLPGACSCCLHKNEWCLL